MSLNLVDLVKTRLGDNPPRQLDSPAEPKPEAEKSAMNAAVPALLAGLSDVASKPEGAAALFNALDQPPANSGGPLLSSLLGDDRLGGLAGAIAAFTGLNTETANRLLGSLMPTVLEVLRQQSKSLGLDAAGLTGLLAGQQQNIRDALPSGLGPLLSRIPGLSGFPRRRRQRFLAVASRPVPVCRAGFCPRRSWSWPESCSCNGASIRRAADNGNAAVVAEGKAGRNGPGRSVPPGGCHGGRDHEKEP